MPVVNGEDYQKEKLEGDTCKNVYFNTGEFSISR
jgi:hypothetical protein